MESYMILVTDSGNLRFDDAVSFSFERERYRCYTEFHGVFRGTCAPEEVLEVRFYLDGKLLHRGTADSVVSEQSGTRSLVRVMSFSFTMSLGQNQLEPGIITDANMLKIVERSLANRTDFSFQSDTPTVNYVYINEKSTMWEAMCVYTAKAFENYPYIRAQNTVWCDTSKGAAHDYSGEKIVAVNRGVSLSKLISEVYTEGTDDEWSVTLTDDFAKRRHIAKQRYYPRDREWLYDQTAGLRYHLGEFAGGRQYKEFTYVGFKGEELRDTALLTAAGVTFSNCEICRVRVTGSQKGVLTTIGCYSDVYTG